MSLIRCMSGLVQVYAVAGTPPSIRASVWENSNDTTVTSMTISPVPSYTAGDYVLVVSASNATQTPSAVSGGTDDTYTEIAEKKHSSNGATLSLWEGTISNTFDSSIGLTLDQQRTNICGAITISGAAGNASQPNVAVSSNEGYSSSPTISGVTTSTANCLLIGLINGRGDHSTNLSNYAPSGWTNLMSDWTNSSVGPGNTSHTSLCIIYKTQASAGATGDVTCTTCLDGSARWVTQLIAIAPD